MDTILMIVFMMEQMADIHLIPEAEVLVYRQENGG